MTPPPAEQGSDQLLCWQLQPQEISPPPTANLDRSNDRVYENVTGLVKAVIEMSSKIQPAPPEEYVPMVKVSRPRRQTACRPRGACGHRCSHASPPRPGSAWARPQQHGL